MVGYQSSVMMKSGGLRVSRGSSGAPCPDARKKPCTCYMEYMPYARASKPAQVGMLSDHLND